MISILKDLLNSDDYRIDLSEHEELIYRICIYTGLEFEKSKIIAEAILSEIRDLILNGEKIDIYNLGIFSLYKRYFKFKTNKKIKKALND